MLVNAWKNVPFGALSFEDNTGLLSGTLAECVGMCQTNVQKKQSVWEKAGSFDKDKWKDF